MTGPLILSNVPGSIQTLYKNLSTFLTEQCGLSIRYLIGESAAALETTNMREKLRDAIINNDSLRMRSMCWELDAKGHVAIPDDLFNELSQSVLGGRGVSPDAQQFKFKKNRPPLEESLEEIEELVKEVLNDRSSLVKLVGVDLITKASDVSAAAKPRRKSANAAESGSGEKTDEGGEKGMMLLWGWGISAAENDREIKFSFCDSRIDSEQLQTACLLHSLIETCWWHPLATSMSASPSQAGSSTGFGINFVQGLSMGPGDEKRFVSCIVDENLCYFPMGLVALLQRSQIFDQHFEEKEGRVHTPGQCTCQKAKSYHHSFLMKKVSFIKQILLQKSLDACPILKYAEQLTAHGPDPVLKLYLHLIKQQAEQQ